MGRGGITRRRAILGLAGMAVVGGAGIRMASIDGWWRPIEVGGPSMIPTLWGPSRQTDCQRCGWQWRVYHDSALGSRSIRCFRCGHMGVTIDETVAPGDRVWVDRAAFAIVPPRRGDLVAIAKPEGGMEVKRVAGLPGETVAIDSDGRVWIDERPLVLSPEEAWTRSVVVYDDRGRRESDSRWHAESPGGWLVYHHEDIYDGGRPAPICDDNPANATVRRETFPVWDLRLEMRLRTARGCRLEVVVFHRDRPTGVSLEIAAGDAWLRIGNSGDRFWCVPMPSGPMAGAAETAARPLELVGQTREAMETLLGAERPAALRVRGDRDAVPSEIWLGRGVRYDPPWTLRERWRQGVRVERDRLVVLGDNPPVSRDSRAAPEGVPLDRILGRVIPRVEISDRG